MTAMTHLARRFFTSLSRRPPDPADTEWALTQLLPGEVELWQRMPVQDRRHSLLVARRFVADGPAPERPEVAAALLHDVGKLQAELGTLLRVVATVIGPHTDRFRRYHDHESLGAEMAAAAGSAQVTVELIRGHGAAAARLRSADQV